jgi:cytoskeletal protein RodZ
MIQRTFPGGALRKRRESLGLSIDDVFRKTRIPSSYLEALEGGVVDTLPSTCYAVGFLKSYCQFLGMDSERYVDSFRGALAGSPRRSTGFLGGNRFWGRSHASGPPELQKPGLLSDVVTWAAICAILALTWAAYTVTVRPKAEVTDGRVQAGTVEMKVPPLPPDPDF